MYQKTFTCNFILLLISKGLTPKGFFENYNPEDN